MRGSDIKMAKFILEKFNSCSNNIEILSAIRVERRSIEEHQDICINGEWYSYLYYCDRSDLSELCYKIEEDSVLITDVLDCSSNEVNYNKLLKCKENEETYLIKTNIYKHTVCLGTTGRGRAIHPWDGLKKCTCGGSGYMVGKGGNDIKEGYPYKIKCIKCSKETSSGDVLSVRDEWNSFNNVES